MTDIYKNKVTFEETIEETNYNQVSFRGKNKSIGNGPYTNRASHRWVSNVLQIGS